MIYTYPKFKIRIDPDSKQRQGLQAGDVVRRQYLDGNASRYSLMAVLETGTEWVENRDGTRQPAPYFIGALLEGDEPRNGELLDFVRITSLTDLSRSGALYLTSSDNQAPYLDVIDGMGSERSLCRPSGNEDICRGRDYLDCSYTPADEQATRIHTLRRNQVPAGAEPFGLELPLPATLDHPQRIVISFRTRSSKALAAVPLTVGYSDGTDTDGRVIFDAGPQWNYHLFVVTIDNPPSVERALSVELSGHLTAENDTLSVADLNVVSLGDLSDYPAASKARVGKITGIVDPLFGVLDGYGAYFQNLYATRNVNVAGTLTAGDEDGFASTFYVGRIHKNCMVNSLEGNFRTAVTRSAESAPTGIGIVTRLQGPSAVLECQSEAWTRAHAGQRYCFSFWAKSDAADPGLQLSYNDTVLGTFPLEKEWRRFHAAFDVAAVPGECLTMTFSGAAAAVACYQMESGERPSLYQPTDSVLDQTDDYGAWFSRGGIGGTIQNPLLKLESDGSIRSAGGSFVINADGTGYFANGKFKWDKEHIELTGLDLDWKEIAQYVPKLDWVEQWNSGKTHIGAELVVTPKIFAGIKHDDGLLTGVALGSFSVTMYNEDQSALMVSNIEGIAGFDHGRRVFSIENTGNVSLGYGTQSIRYNAATGKIEFGSGVSAQWAGATYIDANGIFTGTLSAETVSAFRLDASQITAGTIDAARIDTESLKTLLLTAENIEALTLNVKQGTIGGWAIDQTSIYRGTKKDTPAAFTDNLSDITIGQAGLRGHQWRLDADGTGAIAGDNIWWDTTGNLHFGESVTALWQNGIDAASELARAMAWGKMLFRDPTFEKGDNGITPYNALENGKVTVNRVDDPAAPNDSHRVLEISVTGDAAPGYGGFGFGNTAAADKRFVVRMIAKIPAGFTLQCDSKGIGTDGACSCLTSAGGTGKWEEYIFKVVCGSEGSFGSTDYFYLGANSSAVLPIVWCVAYGTVFDVTSAEKYVTTIDSEGIYTGSLNAGQITTGFLSAERLEAGSIKAEKLDADSIRADIVNASYVSGLECTFTHGTIGGWNIGAAALSANHILLDSGNKRVVVYGENVTTNSGPRVQLYYNNDADFGFLATDTNGDCMASLGSNNRIAGWTIDTGRIRKNNVVLGEDGSIANAEKWKLGNDGSGQIASGNIAWNAAGEVTFSASVSLVWKEPIENITTALGGDSFSKLTQLTGTGIYTGTLTAGQVNAVDIDAGSIRTGTLSADRIAAGSIKAEKLDTQSIKTEIINTDYINGLECTFVQGKIGGWTITGDSLSAGYLGAMYETPIQLRPASSGSGEWYLGQYKPLGMTVTWHQAGNAGHIVFGQVATNGSLERTGFIGLQMMSWIGEEYFCLSADTTYQGGRSVYNRIAGWAFDHQQIWKNGVSLGADGSIQNSGSWQLNNDGSGRVASGNIAWDAAGNVTFGPQVTMQWIREDQKGRIYVRGTGLNNNLACNVRVNGQDVLIGYERGLTLTLLNRSDLSLVSSGSYDVYLGDYVCDYMAAALDNLGQDKIVILTSFDAILINERLRIAIERCGGDGWTGYGRYPYAFLGIPGIGKGNGLTSVSETGATDPYAEISTRMIEGVPVGVNIGAKRFTYINGYGIYTGFISAGQINVDTSLVVGGSSYDGSISVRDAANNVKVTLNRAGITAVGGTIGGWSLTGSQIYSGSVVLSNDGTISNGARWKLNTDGSGYLANNNFAWDTYGNIYAKGGTFEQVIIKGTLRNSFINGINSYDTCDNVIAIRGGAAVSLPWTREQGGRRLCLVNYMWHGSAPVGYMEMTAPSGYWFYENGIQKQTIQFSREVLELMGYGDDQSFYGWIVLNRRDVMAVNYQGFYPQILAEGYVNCTKATSRGVVMKYRTFDGQGLTATHTSQGFFTINMPWSLGVDNYMVMLSGRTSAVQNVSIYATVRNQYANYFTVTTQDDSSVNDGSFNFQIISTADFITWTQP